ncbi:MAG: dihydropteroate synthase [Sphingomonadaceae bacterium]
MTIPPTATLYLRPTAFIDAPFGLDGQFERLAGGMQFFSAWDVIAVEGGRRLPQQLVPVERIDHFLKSLSRTQVERAQIIIERATAPRAPLQLGERTIRLDQPQVMGILNMTPDSFSGGSDHLDDPAAAAALGVDLSSAGAAIIDIGGESTRPGAADVWEQDEIARVVPVIERLAASGTAISIDTRKSAVMERALIAGAAIVNDVSALLFDDRSLPLVAKAACPVVLMHYPGKPSDPHAGAAYHDPLIEVYDWLGARIEAAVAGGIDRSRIIVDPGIGFGKSVAQNLTLLNGLALFHGLGCPILLGASRKRLIGALSNEVPANKRLGGSVALALKGAEQGAQIIRVHDVFESVQALHIWRGMRDAALSF